MQRLATLLALYLAACTPDFPDKIVFGGSPSVLQQALEVRVQDSVADDDKLFVRLYVTNTSKQPIQIDRSGMGLRLPNGGIVWRQGVDDTLIHLAPGAGEEIFLAFDDGDRGLKRMQKAALIVGGVSLGDDARARVIGEVALKPTGRRRGN